MRSSRVVVLLAALLLAGGGACGGSNDEAAATARAAASQALLKRYVDTLRQAVQAGSPGPVVPQLGELTSEAAALRVGDDITDDFFARFSRLLIITLAIVDPNQGENTMLAAERSLLALADSIGHTDPVALNDGLAGVAPLLQEEVLRLHLLTDPTADRGAAESLYFPK